MKTGKIHITFMFILFGIAGALLTGVAGQGLLYLARAFWDDELLGTISYMTAFIVAAVPGFTGSFYWTYFFIKKERRETKHLHDKKSNQQG